MGACVFAYQILGLLASCMLPCILQCPCLFLYSFFLPVVNFSVPVCAFIYAISVPVLNHVYLMEAHIGMPFFCCFLLAFQK